jgi:LAGLIDADG endonuclease
MINLIAMKIHQLYNLIDWLNKNHSTDIKKLPLNKDNLENSSWLSGFVDAVGSFHIRISQKEIEDQGNLFKFTRVACRLRIEHKMYDPTVCGCDYESIFKEIATFLHAPLKINKYQYLSITATNKESIKIVQDYFNRYPLFSSKYLDYKDWGIAVNLMHSKAHYKEENSRLIYKLKAGMNDNRQIFNWTGLARLN